MAIPTDSREPAVDPAAPTIAVRLEGVVKTFGNDEAGKRVAKAIDAGPGDLITAVAGIDLDIVDGEFFSMLGPSGSGKTTTLRMIAGFELPTRGRILLHGEDVSNKPPFERDVNTVFQDYALFPHMTVGDNVGYGLMIRKVPKADRARQVTDALRMVRLDGYEARRPGQLSGGQRQRVALARALVNRPRVLLLDEPLGALDLRLREEMQIELKSIQQEVGITFIYVTHDQGEALTMSDRLAVFSAGRIEQIGTPAEVYEHPVTQFVAGFVGTSNLLTGDAAKNVFGEGGSFSVRPEKIRVAGVDEQPGADESSSLGVISKVIYLGPETRLIVDLDGGGQLSVMQQNMTTESSEALALEGRRVRLTWKRLHNLALAGAA